MKQSSKRAILIALAAALVSTTAPSVQAGQFLDSLLGRRSQPAFAVGAPVPVSSGYGGYGQGANYAAYPGYANYPVYNQTAGYGAYSPPVATNAPILPPGLTQSVPALLPTAAYDSQWARTPVTYYRPVTAFDPRYGTTVTSLQPCTSYQYQTQRAPVIAPRPLLGDYGSRANQYPGITTPGYNPTGLAYAAAYPGTYQPLQQIPVSGTPLILNGGSSSGMPTSNLPLTTMNYGPVTNNASMLPTYAFSQNTPVIPSGSWGSNSSGPVISSYGYAPQNTYPSAANSAPYCGPMTTPLGNAPILNGASSPGPNGFSGTNMTPPSIPGAIVSPLGPPTFSNTPGNVSGPLSNPAGSGFTPVMPPTGNGLQDQESLVVPSLNRFNSTTPASPLQSSGQGTLAANVQSSRPVNEPSETMSREPATPRPMVAIDPPRSPARPYDAPSTLNQSITGLSAPSLLPSTTPKNSVVPLQPPAGFESKPRWNPSLLDPKDKQARGVDRGLVKFVNNTKDATPSKKSAAVDGFRPSTQPK